MRVLNVVLARFLALALVLPLLSVSPTAPGATGTPARGSEAPHHVLVFGGTGHLGAEIVERLVARGDRVTVFTRPGSEVP